MRVVVALGLLLVGCSGPSPVFQPGTGGGAPGVKLSGGTKGGGDPSEHAGTADIIPILDAGSDGGDGGDGG